MLAARAALAWARAYTSGMPEPVRSARLDELASDLWEHREHGVASGRRPLALQLAIGGRIARGAGADLAWRLTHPSGLAVALLRSASWAVFAASAAFLLFFTAVSGAPVLGIYRVEGWEPGDAREFARAMAALFVALFAGLALLRVHPIPAAALVTVASASLVVYAGCLAPLFSTPALACTAGAVVLALRSRRARPPAPRRA